MLIRLYNLGIIFKNNKIGRRLFSYFLITTFIMGLTCVFTYYNAKLLTKKINEMFFINIKLNEMYENINKLEKHLEIFLVSKDSESLKTYYMYSQELKKKADLIHNGDYLNYNQILLNDISNMCYSYLEEAEESVNAKRGRNIEDYSYHFDEAKNIAKYINTYINKMIHDQFQSSTSTYISISSKLEIMQLICLCAILCSIIFNIILIMWLMHNITKPIIQLSNTANTVSTGNFNADFIKVESNDELQIMAEAFNRMLYSIKNYINELKQKANLEYKLNEQEMQNLKMNHLLKEAQLKALQSQINPHFLFNTLNAGVQLAMLEGSDKTGTFIENVAKLLRYNLKKIETPVTINDEILNVESYIYILKTRFGDKFQFLKHIDLQFLNIIIPCMILQPIVENAFIHGINGLDNDGIIKLSVSKVQSFIHISISDNGVGMTQSKISAILSNDSTLEKSSDKSHASGIGITNVISRLRIYFNKEDIVEIHSSLNNGSDIVIKIPISD